MWGAGRNLHGEPPQCAGYWRPAAPVYCPTLGQEECKGCKRLNHCRYRLTRKRVSAYFKKKDRELNWIAEPEHFTKYGVNYLPTFVFQGIAEQSSAIQKQDRELNWIAEHEHFRKL